MRIEKKNNKQPDKPSFVAGKNILAPKPESYCLFESFKKTSAENDIEDFNSIYLPFLKNDMNSPDKTIRRKALVKNVAVKTGLREKCINHIIKHEDVRLTAYKDQRGIVTIGIGENTAAKKEYRGINQISEKTAFSRFAKSLNGYQKDLNSLLCGTKITRGQREALVDLTFNAGPNALKGTKLLENIKEGDFNNAVKEFNFVKAGKKVSLGLCKRRMENILQFSEGINSASTMAALKSIYTRGVATCEKDIRSCSTKGRRDQLVARKANFIKDAQEIMNKLNNPRLRTD